MGLKKNKKWDMDSVYIMAQNSNTLYIFIYLLFVKFNAVNR
jgi:hypothetical protein